MFRRRLSKLKRSSECVAYGRGVWTRRKAYWRQKKISRATYVALARQRAPIARVYALEEVPKQHIITRICSTLLKMMEKVMHTIILAEVVANGIQIVAFSSAFQEFAPGTKYEELCTVIGIHVISLLMGPAFSSDMAGDGPKSDKDNECKDGQPIHERSSSSDSKTTESNYRPPTPTKPRRMTRRKYKNLVRLHR